MHNGLILAENLRRRRRQLGLAKPGIAILRLEHFLRRSFGIVSIEQIHDIMSIDRPIILRFVQLGTGNDEVAIAYRDSLMLR